VQNKLGINTGIVYLQRKLHGSLYIRATSRQKIQVLVAHRKSSSRHSGWLQ
jgi:hypothetical protein